jgi:hypothetical protein
VVPLKKSLGHISSIGVRAILIGALSLVTQALPAQATSVAAKLAIVTPAAGAASGVAFTAQPSIAVQDSAGNTIATNASTVSVALTGGAGGALVGSTTKAAVAGVATFSSLGISGIAGTVYTLTFSDGALAVATETITPTAGAANWIQITSAAGGTVTGSAFMAQPIVMIRDAKNNLVTGGASTVTVAITGGAGGTLSGSTTATATAGVATFAGLGITGTVGTAYTLTYSDGALKAATQTVIPIAAAVIPAPVVEDVPATSVVPATNKHSKPAGQHAANGGAKPGKKGTK